MHVQCAFVRDALAQCMRMCTFCFRLACFDFYQDFDGQMMVVLIQSFESSSCESDAINSAMVRTCADSIELHFFVCFLRSLVF